MTGRASPEKRLRRARIAAATWGVFLIALTSWPSPPKVPIVSAIPEFDLFAHAWLYAVEGFLLYRAVAWPGRPAFSLLRAFAVVGSLAVWGSADEIHQAWIPGREMEGKDLMADIGGAAVGAAVASAISGRRGFRLADTPA